ncbi:gene transfer agent family protein [Blastochloris tepida]|uniref:Transfer Agent n=1 Tax=Blastochloris tepida TaxID=2233851 RepID=A0A348FYS9_9HYPH|nr:gene transfer agent family protein [Blastochloris tepida]BBF92462.1 hypothetical protein BLTE_11470 [Blastochloris tepida]
MVATKLDGCPAITRLRVQAIEATLSGHDRRLTLTLGAIAELEAAFGAHGLDALEVHFKRGQFTAREIASILGAGLRGAGETIADAEVLQLTHRDGARGMAALATALLLTAFPTLKEDASAVQNAPAPSDQD